MISYGTVWKLSLITTPPKKPHLRQAMAPPLSTNRKILNQRMEKKEARPWPVAAEQALLL